MLSAPFITIKNLPKKVVWASKVGLGVFVRFLAQKQTFLKKFSLFEIVTQKTKLRYESSTLILYKELRSPIFQSLSVRP